MDDGANHRQSLRPTGAPQSGPPRARLGPLGRAFQYRSPMGGSPERGETLEEFVVRTLRGINAALENGDVTVVAHGGTFAVLLAAIGHPLRRPEKYGARVLDNAAPMHVTPPEGDGTWKVEAL